MGPLGLILIALGFRELRRAALAGERQRPLEVTIIGVFVMADASINFVSWAVEILGSSTHLVQAFVTGYGLLFDGGYYVGFNTLMLGGATGAGEKGWGVTAVMLLFPIRIVAVWAFLEMKRWGYDFMVLTSWTYAITFFGYLVNVTQDFDVRFGASRFGVVGWWAVFMWYLTPYVVLPWLYALNREKWTNRT